MKIKRFLNFYNKGLSWIGWKYHKWQPFWLKKFTSPTAFAIYRFCKDAGNLMKNKLILDAGAGNARPYKHFFEDNFYHSTDIEDETGIHTFTCNLEDIPADDNFYDGILCTETLEHVKDYSKAISEFYRIFKPNGRLFITVPLQARFHSAPYHYFNFTESGLKYIFEKNGFFINKITPRIGAFSFIVETLDVVPQDFYLQQVRKNRSIIATMLLPFLLLNYLLLIPISFLCFFLDKLDQEKYITSGYTAIRTKPEK